MLIKSILKIGSIAIISIGLASCDSLFASHQNPLTIEKIANKKSGKTVYITGEVIRTINLVKNGAYLLQDDTGKIWIVTSDRLPSVGDKISIKGTINYQELPLNKEELYLQELEVKEYLESPSK